MWDFLRSLFDASDFPPRWECGNWSGPHGWTHIAADLGIFGAYTAIPVVLAYFVTRRRDVPFPRVFWLFVLFIFSCGTSHLLEAVVFWNPVYRLAAVVKVVTALASWATVLAMIPMLPRALALPGLQKANADLQAAETALVHANEQLAHKNREIEEFISIITHDLKHPAVSIQWLLSALKEQASKKLDEPERSSLDMMLAECARMKEMLTELTELSRLERVEVVREQLDLYDFLRACVDPLNARMRAVGGAFHVQAPHAQLPLPRALLQQALSNLLDNAIKYGCPPDRCRIDVTAHVEARLCRITVRDYGPGIEPADHERVFQPFRRLARHEQAEGYGLGLPAVRRLVQRFGGAVTLESDGRTGAAFTITFPVT